MEESINKFVYQLNENDYLIFQLFSGSKSKLVTSKRKNEWMLFWFLPFVFGLYYLTSSNRMLSIYFFIIASLFFLFYKKFFNYRYKKRYQRIIKLSHQENFDSEEVLEITPSDLFVKNKTGEGSISFSAITTIDEISTHIFIKLDSGSSLILPKSKIDSASLKEEFAKLSIPIREDFNWVWE